jgi:hypothetical protein
MVEYEDAPITEATQWKENDEEKSRSELSVGEDKAKEPDQVEKPPRSQTTEMYESFLNFYVLTDNISSEFAGDISDPMTQYNRVIKRIVDFYGSQQAEEVEHTTDEYREAYGNGDTITSYSEISAAHLSETSIEFLSEKGDVEDPVLYALPLTPEKEKPLYEIVKTGDDLKEALERVSKFPAEPARGPDDECSSERLPIVEIYNSIFKDEKEAAVSIDISSISASENDPEDGGSENDYANSRMIFEFSEEELNRINKHVGDINELTPRERAKWLMENL